MYIHSFEKAFQIITHSLSLIFNNFFFFLVVSYNSTVEYFVLCSVCYPIYVY